MSGCSNVSTSSDLEDFVDSLVSFFSHKAFKCDLLLGRA